MKWIDSAVTVQHYHSCVYVVHVKGAICSLLNLNVAEIRGCIIMKGPSRQGICNNGGSQFGLK